MAKNNLIRKLVNGEVADADDVNQAIENAGNEGGAIPYDPTTHTRDDDGNESIGSANYPWGDIFVNQDAYLKETVTGSASVSASVQFKNLRRFIYLKDAPSSYSGQANKFVAVNAGETGLEFITSPSKSNLIFELQADVDTISGTRGRYTGTSLTPSTANNEYSLLVYQGDSFATISSKKWKKIPGVNTVTVYAQYWVDGNTGTIQVDIGGATGSTTTTGISPGWVNFTVDVSGLSDGTTYDVAIQVKNGISSGWSYLGNLSAFGS